MDINKENHAAKFTFLYVLSLVAVVFVAISTGMIIFQIINKSIVDIISQYSGQYTAESLRFGISALLISAPIFYITTRQIHRSLFTGDLKKDSNIRKWLSYLVLLVSSVVAIVWLIITLNNFLNGELTIKFILKAITAIGISAIIFSFYLYDIKRVITVGVKNKVIKTYFWISLVLIGLTFISGLLFVESPREARNVRIDGIILNNFTQIENGINNYYNEYRQLPETLDALNRDIFLEDQSLYDPETKELIEYKKTGDTKYEICATFRTASNDTEQLRSFKPYSAMEHEAGHQCLERQVYSKDSVELKPIIR